MQKEFNDTGLCVPDRHYMADSSNKLDKIVQLVEKGKYFTINRPRQFGKTTTLSLLAKRLNKRKDYFVISLSFEDIDTDTYQNYERFFAVFLDMIKTECEFLGVPEVLRFVEDRDERITDIPGLSRFVTRLVRSAKPERAFVLLIDEVDKSPSNRVFLDFLGMLRNKYLRRQEGKDHSFQSVILAGVHDVKTRKYNSPWNIAADFDVDLSFSTDEIETMLQEYSREKNIRPDISGIAGKLRYYTSGYPFLVSKLCKFIDEKIVPEREDKNWHGSDVDKAFAMIVRENYTTTLFDSLTNNLENNKELYENVFGIVINGKRIPFNISVPVIAMGAMYGIFADSGGGCKIHNRIFEQRIYDYMMTKLLTSQSEPTQALHPDYHTEKGLDVTLILQKFQDFMKEHGSRQDRKFLEREGRLLFLSFLRPIINGKGFEFKEPNVGDERRMDLVITYKNRRYVVELKRWYGPKAHREGLRQLSEYLDMYSLKRGWLLIYDFNENKEYRQEEITFQDKRIFAVWV